MSHFTVLVIGPDVEGQLAPYQENNLGGCPRQYLEFHDVEDEYRKEYANDGVDMIEMEDGELVYEWDNRFKKGDFLNQETVIPAHLKRRHVKHSERYDSFGSFVEDWAGYEKDEALGRYGYWENPNAKWDWYQIGGRWTGFFKLKAGRKGDVGEPGILTPIAQSGSADILTKGDIDFEAMRDEAGEKAAEEYDRAMKIIGHLPPNKTWEEMRGDDKDADKTSKKYWAQPRCRAWDEKRRANWEGWPFAFDSSPDDYIIPRDRFIKNARDAAGIPFALIKDGKWLGRGEMGWWACVSNEKDRETWNSVVANIIDGLPDDTPMTLVDCHI